MLQAIAKQDDHIPTSVVAASATSRRRESKEAYSTLPVSTPQSPCGDSSPFGEPFGCNHRAKAVPVYGESGTKCRKGNGSEPPCAVFYRRTRSYIKPTLKGEVDFAKQKTEGLQRGFSVFRQPLSQALRLASSPFGEPFALPTHWTLNLIVHSSSGKKARQIGASGRSGRSGRKGAYCR